LSYIELHWDLSYIETWDVTKYYGIILVLIETFKVQSWPGINFFLVLCWVIWGYIVLYEVTWSYIELYRLMLSYMRLYRLIWSYIELNRAIWGYVVLHTMVRSTFKVDFLSKIIEFFPIDGITQYKTVWERKS